MGWQDIKFNCSGCEKPYYIINVKYNLCQSCNRKRLNKDKPIKIYYPKQKSATGEKELNLEIWGERPHRCTNCDCCLNDEFNPSYFSHTIRKSKRSDLRLKKENIMIECEDCHQIWDNGDMNDKYLMNTFTEKMSYIFKEEKPLYYHIIGVLENDYAITFTSEKIL